MEEWEEDPEQARADDQAEEENRDGVVDEAELRMAVERAKEMDDDIAAGAEAPHPAPPRPRRHPDRSRRKGRIDPDTSFSRNNRNSRNSRAGAGRAR